MTITVRPAEGTQEGPVSGAPPSLGKPKRQGLVQRLRTALANRRFNTAQRRNTAGRRRIMAGRRRVQQRVEMLGPQWRIVDYHPEDPDFLAIGPGGIFQVTVVDHGKASVDLAGDVVQIGGRRPPYVALARRDAGRISAQMSQVARRRIPVVPVVAFLGRGRVVYWGQPPEGCIVTTYGDLGRALNAHGNRISPATIEKLVIVAARVDTSTIGQYLDIAHKIPSQRETDR